MRGWPPPPLERKCKIRCVFLLQAFPKKSPLWEQIRAYHPRSFFTPSLLHFFQPNFCRYFFTCFLREGTHKTSFFIGKTTKGVGRLTPPPFATKHKTTFFCINIRVKSGFFSPKIWEFFVAKIRFRLLKDLKKKKMAWTTKPLV